MTSKARPRNTLRADETIWARAGAHRARRRLDDTPPYTLEYGGDVVNAAVT